MTVTLKLEDEERARRERLPPPALAAFATFLLEDPLLTKEKGYSGKSTSPATYSVTACRPAAVQTFIVRLAAVYERNG